MGGLCHQPGPHVRVNSRVSPQHTSTTLQSQPIGYSNHAYSGNSPSSASSASCHRLIQVRHQRVWSVFIVGPHNVHQSAFFTALKQYDNCSGIVQPENMGTVFLLHGVGGCAWVWQHQIVYFAQMGYTVIIPELPGHGLSPTLNNSRAYLFSELSEDVMQLFDTYRDPVPEKNILVGHSYGCSLATYVVHERRQCVHRLVLISGGAPDPLGPTQGFFNLPVCILACIMPCVMTTFRKRAFAKQCHLQTGVRRQAFKVSSQVLRDVMVGQIWDEGGEELHENITTPTLLLCGAQDLLVHIDEEGDMLATLPVAWLRCVEGAGHMVMLECPDQVNRFIHTFVDHRRDEHFHVQSRLKSFALTSCQSDPRYRHNMEDEPSQEGDQDEMESGLGREDSSVRNSSVSLSTLQEHKYLDVGGQSVHSKGNAVEVVTVAPAASAATMPRQSSISAGVNNSATSTVKRSRPVQRHASEIPRSGTRKTPGPGEVRCYYRPDTDRIEISTTVTTVKSSTGSLRRRPGSVGPSNSTQQQPAHRLASNMTMRKALPPILAGRSSCSVRNKA